MTLGASQPSASSLEDTPSLPGNDPEEKALSPQQGCRSSLVWRPEDGHSDLRRPLVATGILGSLKRGLRKTSAKPVPFFFYERFLLDPRKNFPNGKTGREKGS